MGKSPTIKHQSEEKLLRGTWPEAGWKGVRSHYTAFVLKKLIKKASGIHGCPHRFFFDSSISLNFP